MILSPFYQIGAVIGAVIGATQPQSDKALTTAQALQLVNSAAGIRLLLGCQ